MKISYNWLEDYVDIDKSPEQLAEDLSLFGFDLETIEKIGDDTVLDLEITPNRGDCLSVLGLAREISAMYNTPLKDSTTILRSIEVAKLDKNIKVEISDPKVCPRFTARIIENIKIGESPKWMQERLASYGFRPLNNIVDITNYVMIATGQPLHAFDYAKIKNGLMKIRLSKQGEEIMTLDGKNHVLPDKAIIIEDDEKIFDLAGIMGGLNSEVDENTKTIVLQGAIFDPILIRRASKYLNLTTDASYRYERGVDFEGTIRGVDIAASLIKESCPEARVGELIDRKIEGWRERRIDLDINKVNKLLGTNVSQNDAKEYLERLYFKIEGNQVTVPSFRSHDVNLWQDLAEEIARVYGYNKITKSPITKPASPAGGSQSPGENDEWQKRESIKDVLKSLGFVEIYSYSFADRDKIELLGEKIEECVEMANPLSPETQYLRPSVLSSLLAAVAKNPWAPEVNIFEIEKVFDKEREKWQLGIATVGKSDSILKEAIKKLDINAEIKSIDQRILDVYKIRRPIRYVVCDMSDVALETRDISQEISKNRYRPISKFPPTVRDLAFIVETSLKSEQVKEEILKTSDKIFLVELFDEFESSKFGKNKKNIAFHIWLQDMAGPLDNQEGEMIIKDIIKKVEEKFQARLRE